MLAPHAVDIAVTISSLIASLCFTFAEAFDNIFLFVKWSCALVSGNTNKGLRKDRRTPLPNFSESTLPDPYNQQSIPWPLGSTNFVFSC